MKFPAKLLIMLTFVLTLVGAFTPPAPTHANEVKVWVGRWKPADIPGDGSTNILTITWPASRSSSDYRPFTFFSLCEGAPGIGRGTGVEARDGKLLVSMDFFCLG